ncbi:hypothetical protein [Paraburkholderia hospita]|uniref:hypothetical protein n=1 Tax=Paraburkholderia hospita TaxID=169430 RepID=UPI000B6E3ACD|nr:hypothetical protein [Paraburkholderia hospita]OUL68696.1 hypothetical protein CA603_51560 [Paraburkholderia hospita]
MTIEQDFLPFAANPGANVETQAAYVADAATLANGFSAGVAPSVKLNKVWRQSSIMSAVLAQFIVNQTGQPAIDDGTTATLLANLATAVAVSARQNPVLTDTGAANAYVVANLSAFSAYPTVSGLIIDVSIANANTGASTLNVDGLGTKPILGLGLQPLQGGELIVKGVACLMYVVASTVNGGNGAWIVMECTGGAQQIAPATQSAQALQLQQNTGVVGTARNLVANLASAATSITFTANEIAIKGAFAGQSQTAANFNQSVSTSNTNAIGGIVGTALAASGYAGIYAAYNPSTGAFGAYGKNANSLLSNVDTSLTGWIGTLISVWPLNASTQFVAGYQIDRYIALNLVTGATFTTAQTNTAVTLPIPANATSVKINQNQQTASSATGYALSIAGGPLSGSSGVGAQTCNLTGTGLQQFETTADIPLVTPQTVRITWTVTGGTSPTLNLYVTGYSI